MARHPLRLLHAFALVSFLVQPGWSLSCSLCAYNATAKMDAMYAPYTKECDCGTAPKQDEPECKKDVTEAPVFCLSALVMKDGAVMIERFGVDKDSPDQLPAGHNCSTMKVNGIMPMVVCSCDADWCNKMTEAELMAEKDKLVTMQSNMTTTLGGPGPGGDDDGSTDIRASAYLLTAALIIFSWTTFKARSGLQ